MTRSRLLLLLLHHLASHTRLGDPRLLGGGHLHPVGGVDGGPRPQREARQLGRVDGVSGGVCRRSWAVQGVQGVTGTLHTATHTTRFPSLLLEHALALCAFFFLFFSLSFSLCSTIVFRFLSLFFGLSSFRTQVRQFFLTDLTARFFSLFSFFLFLFIFFFFYFLRRRSHKRFFFTEKIPF